MCMVIICRPFITLRGGKVIYASHYRKTAFCFPVDEEYKRKRPRKHKDVIEESMKS